MLLRHTLLFGECMLFSVENKYSEQGCFNLNALCVESHKNPYLLCVKTKPSPSVSEFDTNQEVPTVAVLLEHLSLLSEGSNLLMIDLVKCVDFGPKVNVGLVWL